MDVELAQRADQEQKQESLHNTQLSSKQMSFLNTLLPKGYSFQIQSKPSKRAIKAIKQASMDEPDFMFGVPSQGNISASSRIKKVSSNIAFNQQIENSLIVQKAGSTKALSALNISQDLKPCVKILNSLKTHKTAWPFLEPVDPVTMGIPHYKQIVKEPMDLHTIQNHLLNDDYATPTQFHADINKIINNSYIFNKDNKDFMKLTEDFERQYHKLIGDSTRRKENQMMIPQPPNSLNNKSSSKISAKKPMNSQGRESDKPPTLVEKKELTQNIKRLSKQDLKGMIQIIYPNPSQVKDNLDIEQLQPSKIRQLQAYVASKLSFQSPAFQNQFMKNQPQEKNFHKRNNNEESSFEVDSDS